MNKKYLLLFALPFIYLIITGVFLVHWTPFYISNPDPDYCYLFNGMSLASGKMEIGHIDHPGTPVQCFAAVVIFIKHLFNLNTPLYQDVLTHPESYLYAICTAITIVFLFVTWFTGYYIFKRTRNLTLALLFQGAPLIGTTCLYGQNPTPESFIVMVGMFFMAYIYTNSVASNLHASSRQILIYSVFSGFLAACKYTCFPLLILVTFLLPSFRSKIRYVGLSFLFFFIFIIPALPMWRYMTQWVYNLFTHTGIYGHGSEGIINPNEFLNHLRDLFKEDIYFTSIYLLTTVLLLIALLKRKQAQQKSKTYLRLLSGVWLSSTLLILLIAKHYSFHYVIPIRVCFPLALIGSYGVFRDTFKTVKIKPVLIVLFYSFLAFFIFNTLKISYIIFSRQTSYATSNFLNKFPNEPIIISADYQCARIEPSLDFGTAYSADLRSKYWEFLKKLYPYSYHYKQTQNIISHWDDIFYAPELFSKYPKILLYFYKNDSVQRDSILSNFCTWNKSIKLADYKLIYARKESDEYIYELTSLQNISNNLLANYNEINFNFDKITTDKSKFVSENGNDSISGTNALSAAEHHSGSSSILLTQKNQYAINYPIKAFPGYLIIVSTWTKSDDDRTHIVFTSKSDPNFYISGHAVLSSDANGWNHIEYKCLVPSSTKDSAIFFYLYYYGHSYAYFDDLSIKTYPMKN